MIFLHVQSSMPPFVMKMAPQQIAAPLIYECLLIFSTEIRRERTHHCYSANVFADNRKVSNEEPAGTSQKNSWNFQIRPIRRSE